MTLGATNCLRKRFGGACTAIVAPGLNEPRPLDTRERFAQEALGHNSKAVHRAYARRALVKIPSLEDYEKNQTSQTTSNMPS